MKFRVLLTWLVVSAPLFAAPKFAVVRVTDIYRALPSTAATQQAIQEEKTAITEDKRAEGFRKAFRELQALEVLLKENKDEIDTEEGKKMIREFEIKRQEAESLRVDFEQFSEEQMKRINREMVAGMRDSLRQITDAATQLAKERNFDGVMDISGNSNTGIPFLLYVKDAPDLTADLMEMLNQAPLEETPAEEMTSPEDPQQAVDTPPSEDTQPTQN